MFNLVDTLIKPTLTYRSDVWGSRSTLWGIVNKVFLQFLGASCKSRRQQATLSLRVMNTSVCLIFKDGFMFTLYVRKLAVDVFKAAHTFIVWLLYCSFHILYMITLYVNMISISLCGNVTLHWSEKTCIVILTILSPLGAKAIDGFGTANGCRTVTVTVFPFQCTNDYNFTCIYPLLFHLGLL